MKFKRTRVLVTLFLLMIVAMIPVIASAASADNETAPAETTQVVSTEAESEDYSIHFFEALGNIARSTGFASGNWRQYVMIVVACLLLYLAIVKQF